MIWSLTWETQPFWLATAQSLRAVIGACDAIAACFKRRANRSPAPRLVREDLAALPPRAAKGISPRHAQPVVRRSLSLRRLAEAHARPAARRAASRRPAPAHERRPERRSVLVVRWDAAL